MTPAMSLSDKLPHYARLMRIDKPIGTLLLLWPTLWALWIAAAGWPPLHILVIFIVGTFLMRSAGCVINDYADRDFDGHVERTRTRPLATGVVSPGEALALAAALSAAAFVLVLPLNTLTILLSVPALLLAGSYPFTKRFFAIPQAYLGIAFGFGIPMAFAAVTGTVPATGWLMLLANIFWAVAYDTEYAMVDRPDDLKIGIKTSAITFGRHDVLAVMLCYAATFVLLTVVGALAGLGFAWYAGLVVACAIAGYHYTLIRARDRADCFKAFRHNNWVGGAIFAGLFIDLLLRA
ncbi:MAG TPA: 4-hydroxybenzoate octaprenyltransferase [Thauera aminoaromatica]|jgi:4-hydroxybenzoate polyprenyltransferase|uniref:4-hydroxybenzoate octaprenyltransferase n=3 Tax=Thauera aminoaromatica TaxID=164330 RepID=C4ZLI1_THASP|nr:MULTISPECIES: 4-hydroxybenzoate octaprenyltransferase [Thauera]MDA0236302.1 4-hydroxybenzoate octaprenyltransferase [Pseudomonadota bacterium]OPZ05962.1 MAG: 4-hydroxybenzoate octaprenyltransferase [Alphaproteobacteria bacterium ADurb.BinA305]ACK53593.1 4-hydroxybenzoate polyprenyl transferase [Thauera aminoaromatica]KIN89899.1 4-hydroxybenzoate polyprenyl transferase [Thauera sp. SWB20]MBP6133043.1 4-hydroxybenzoate octaprenyltransferase [Thauera sp.]